jgi:valyl-tRNA synthetase
MALAAVDSGDVKFYPAHWEKTYKHWLENIRDWCISRQLWWGHRIPVFYTPDGKYTAASDEARAREKLGTGDGVKLRQDPDVLDTWFSSWLWPLTTMGWLADGETEETPELKRFLPTDLLVTAPDIIFFWVARMVMATLKFKKVIPFKDVYFTSTIRDGQGRKLSKSLGNSPDPLNIIDKYGTDAVRFTIIYLSPLGQDVKMDVDVKAQDIPSMEIGRNFANKIWNAGRFLLMKHDMVNIAEVCPDCEDKELTADELSFADKWILSRYNSTIKKLGEYLNNYKVTEYSKELYDFIWSDFCDWYVEILKVQLSDDKEYSYKQALMRLAFRIYEGILLMLHPVMPFITEEIWHLIGDRNEDESISLQKAPVHNQQYINAAIEDKFNIIRKVVEELRRLRASMNIPPSKKLEAVISVKSEEYEELFAAQADVIKSLARLSKIEVSTGAAKPEGSLASVVREIEVYLILGDAIDMDKEKERIRKEIDRLERNIGGSEKKLANEKFVNNAPEKVVQYEREKLDSMKESLKKVRENLDSLGG